MLPYKTLVIGKGFGDLWEEQTGSATTEGAMMSAYSTPDRAAAEGPPPPISAADTNRSPVPSVAAKVAAALGFSPSHPGFKHRTFSSLRTVQVQGKTLVGKRGEHPTPP